MTALAAPYTLLRRDGEAGISRADPPAAPPPLPEPRGGLTRAEVERLIAERHFVMAFQPVVRLTDRVPVSHEALLRLRPPAGVPACSARAFVDLAQDWGLGPELDAAAVEVALATWPRDAATPVSVNVHARSLGEPLFFNGLFARLNGDLGAVGLEVTGVADAADLDAVGSTVPALRRLGMRVVLDDVGPSEAMLACLKATRFDEIKLSGAMLAQAVAGVRGEKLLRALLALADAAGARVVAKLVETETQAALLRVLGVGYGQGWLFGAPAVPPAERPSLAA